MKTLHGFIGDGTHEDSRDSLYQFIVLSEDAPQHIVDECMEDSEEATVLTVSRAEMDLIHKSTELNEDSHGMPDGHILDLVESYILAWGD